MNNTSQDKLDSIPPAQKVGGMRVKEGHHVPLSNNNSSSTERHETRNASEQQDSNEDQVVHHTAMQRAQEKASRERQAYEMRSHMTSLDSWNTKNNAGNDLGRSPQYNPAFQQRSQNH